MSFSIEGATIPPMANNPNDANGMIPEPSATTNETPVSRRNWPMVKKLVIAKIILCLLLNSCQTISSPRLEMVKCEMRQVYSAGKEDESTMPLDSPLALNVRDQGLRMATYKFFDLYKVYIKEVGKKRAEAWLKQLVAQSGFSVMLTHPVSRFYINDELAKDLFEIGPPSTAYFKSAYGDPPDFEKIREARGTKG